MELHEAINMDDLCAGQNEAENRELGNLHLIDWLQDQDMREVEKNKRRDARHQKKLNKIKQRAFNF